MGIYIRCRACSLCKYTCTRTNTYLQSFRQRHFEARAMVEQEESDALNERSSSTLARHGLSNSISSLARPALSNSRCASLLEALEDPKGYIFPGHKDFFPNFFPCLFWMFIAESSEFCRKIIPTWALRKSATKFQSEFR
jgi:hypothetical protein